MLHCFLFIFKKSDSFLEPPWIELASFTLGLGCYSPLLASLAARLLPKFVKCTPSQLITFVSGRQRSPQGFPGLNLFGGPPLPQHSMNTATQSL
jgi:hypothetical protein